MSVKVYHCAVEHENYDSPYSVSIAGKEMFDSKEVVLKSDYDKLEARCKELQEELDKRHSLIKQNDELRFAKQELEIELKAVCNEHETLVRFGELIKTDMSCCYDAADVVSLWKNRFTELESENRRLKAKLEKAVHTLKDLSLPCTRQDYEMWQLDQIVTKAAKDTLKELDSIE